MTNVATGYLLVDEGSGQVLPIPPGESVAGRSEDATIHLGHTSVSRRHARFENGPDGLWIEDLGSSNGTQVRGTRIHERTRLQEGDSISLGHAEFTIQTGLIAEAPPPPSPPRGKARATQRVSPLAAPTTISLSAPAAAAAASRPPAPASEPPAPSALSSALYFLIGLLLGGVVIAAFVLGR